MLEDTIVYVLLFPTIIFLSSAIFFFCFYIVGNKVAYEFKWRYLRALLLQDKQWYDSVQVEKLPTEFHYNIEIIKDASGKSIGVILNGIGSLIIGIIFSMIYGYLFALFSLLLFFFILLIFFFQLKIVGKAEQREKKEFELSGNESEQALNSIKVVKAYGQESSETSRFEANLSKCNKRYFQIKLVLDYNQNFF